jgi:hypothetical protein
MSKSSTRQSPLALALAAVLLLLASVAPARAADTPAPQEVDLELVIATDVSGSIDNSEAFLQRKGVSEAFRSREVINAIRAGSLRRIGVVYVDFSSRFYNTVVVDWRVISDEKSAIDFADTLMRLPRTRGQGTSLSDAIEFGMELLDSNFLEGAKRTIDLSGDGPNNRGRPITEVRAEALARGITINGLPIIDPYGYDQSVDLDKYFSACVIGGPGAFIQVAKGFDDFARSMRRKLVLEISDARPRRRAQLSRVAEPAPLPRPRLMPRAAPDYAPGCGTARQSF